MKVTVEKRTNKIGDKQALRLVYWRGSHRDENGKLKHDRKHEQLDLYVYTDPKTRLEKQHNKETLQLAEAIKAKRIVEAASGQHGFTDTSKTKASFYGFFEQIMTTKKTNGSSSNYSIWECCLAQLKKYQQNQNMTFEQVTPQAYVLLGEPAETGRVFVGLKYSAYFNLELKHWAMRAEIKNVTQD